MHSTTIFSAVIATLAFLQVTPAPPAFIALGASTATASALTSGLTSGTVSGTIGAGVGAGVACGTGNCRRRRRAALTHAEKVAREIQAELAARQEAPGPGPAPEGIPQHNWDDCYNDALNAQITINGPVGDNHIKIEGLPPTCMTLATVLDGNTSGGPVPTPCGSACIEYSGMTPEEYEQIRNQVNAEVLS